MPFETLVDTQWKWCDAFVPSVVTTADVVVEPSAKDVISLFQDSSPGGVGSGPQANSSTLEPFIMFPGIDTASMEVNYVNDPFGGLVMDSDYEFISTSFA